MKKRSRVICAMSGGVDSSVAAALLKNQGYDVVGIFMKLWAEDTSKTDLTRENICCSADAAAAARAVAAKLDIPFYVVNFAEEFKKAVVENYIEEYESGRTPNPCVVCNRDIKGELLLRKAGELEADYLATGHYARVERENPKLQTLNPKLKEYYLYTAKDAKKDQTYFLWALEQKHLAKLLFPIGDYRKSEVRAIAKKMDLPTAERKESQGICFIPDRDTCGFLRRHGKKLTEPGEIVDTKGNKLGLHAGLINYTVGQRERLGLGGPKAYYVVKLDRTHNRLVVGDNVDLYREKLVATKINWINPGFDLTKIKEEIGAKIRYGHPVEDCKIETKRSGDIVVSFNQPIRAITPGQSIVFYYRDMVLGGGIIKE